MTQLVFWANSSPHSAIYVKNENAKSFALEKPEASRSIINNYYMDDYLSSTKTVKEAAALIQGVIYINKHANFTIHSWASNDDQFLIKIKNTIYQKHN